LTPDGIAILVHTRWHPDDPIGRAKKLDDWRGKNIQALSGAREDVPLLPKYWPVPALEKIRKANAYKFAALYQGSPRPRGNALFNQPKYFEWPAERPRERYSVSYGVDLAYTEKAQKRADFSVLLKMVRVDSRDRDPEQALYYIVDVQRAQVDAPAFTLSLKSAVTKEPGPMLWYASGAEKGAAQFIQEKVDAFEVRNAGTDKFVRAQSVAEMWNLGRILVPGGEDRPEWVDDFLDEVTNFTGVKDAHDDQVDALAAAFDQLHDGDDGEAVIF
jgi:predicted phage terminase large subunit-like protein